MKQMEDDNIQQECLANLKSMTKIIRPIKKDLIADAESLISGTMHISPRVSTERPRTNPPGISSISVPHSSPESETRNLRIFATPSVIVMKTESSSDARDLSPHAGAVVPRKKTRERRAVFRDYGDDNREVYEFSSSTTSVPRDTSRNGSCSFDVSQTAYVPMPPFDSSDRQALKKKRRGSRKHSPH